MTNASGFLQQLERVIAERRSAAPDGSYTVVLRDAAEPRRDHGYRRR